MKSCAHCTYCESRAHPPLYIAVRWCVLADEPAIFVCDQHRREIGADDDLGARDD